LARVVPKADKQEIEMQNQSKSVSSFLFVLALSLGLAGIAGAQESDAKYGWLNGKWEGDIRDRRLTMTLKVVDGNKIQGQGDLRGHPRCTTSVEISGEVKGKTVLLENLYNEVCRGSTPPSTTGRYRLRYDDGKLVGKHREAELSFTKIE
jgi:hypothetical protein